MAFSAYDAVSSGQADLAALDVAPGLMPVLQSKTFIAGILAGLVLGEAGRILFRMGKLTVEAASVIGGRMLQYGAILASVGVLIFLFK